MSEPELKRRIEEIATRQRRLRRRRQLAICWFLAALVGLVIWSAESREQFSLSFAATVLLSATAVVSILVMIANRRRPSDRLRAAREIERLHPDLDEQLLAALEQQPDHQTGRFGYLQRRVIGESLIHSARYDWRRTVPSRSLVAAGGLQLLGLAAFVAAIGVMYQSETNRGSFSVEGSESKTEITDPDVSYGVSVSPGDTSVERGHSVVVSARFNEALPADVTLVVDDPTTGIKRFPLSKSLDDPIFAGMVAGVAHDQKYHVEYDMQRTDDFQITVFEFPKLEQVDAQVTFPEYTKLPQAEIEDTMHVTVVEGSLVTLKCKLNKPVERATLIGKDGSEIMLEAAGGESDVFQATVTPKKGETYQLKLVDDAGRQNKFPPDIQLAVVRNQPPELKIAFPMKDLRVSPIEEVGLEATAWDDYGLQKSGLIYALAEEKPQTVVLAGEVNAKEQKKLVHQLSFEALNAEPDQLVSYYFFAEDFGPDGKIRRTFSDMYFAEVRHFEEIFRQGQAPPGGQSQKKAAGKNAQKAEQLANLQKQIINATWKLIRRETSARPTEKFKEDAELIRDSQQSAIDQVKKLAEKVTDAKSKGYVTAIIGHMTRALDTLNDAASNNRVDPLQPALAAEQAAYQALLKLRAREHRVIQSQQSQSSSNSSASSGQRSKQQLQQLELKNDKNRYESQRQAQSQQKQAENREQLQVLNRLRELARRQAGMNQKIKELENALREAKTEEEKEELRRQLKRLREEQKQMLRDVDELRNRMDKQENQREMAESRKQLDKTREKVLQTSEKLKEGQLSQALNAGTRAERELQQLRDDFRKKTAGQFDEAMKDLRDRARDLSDTQKKLAEKMSNEDKNRRGSLRRTNDREEVADGLQKQKEDLKNVMNDMKQITQKAEHSEPLLSKQLYDTIRKSRKFQTDDALEVASQLLKRGFVPQATEAEKQASKGIETVRRGIEKAAESVLGNELDALKRARQDLEQLSKAVQEEVAQADPEALKSFKPAKPMPDGQSQRRNAKTSKNDTPPGSKKNANSSRRGNKSQQKKSQSSGQGGSQKKQSGDRKSQNSSQKKNNPSQSKSSGKQKQSGSSKSGKQSPGQPGDQKSQKSQQSKSNKPSESKSGQSGQQPSQSGKPNANESKSPNSNPSNPQDSKGQKPGRNRSQPGSRLTQSFTERGGFQTGPGGPLTGQDFQNWSDQLRDVEEMVELPKFREEVARIRDRARSMRIEFKRHSKTPQWSLVKSQILEPLVELQNRLAEEIAKRDSNDAIVPIDRDPVPEEFAEQVRKYYERLGSGKK